jgi:arginine metabolism regulation protein II
MSEDEIFSTLSAIDEISNPSETVTMGPFAIFQVEISSICEYWSYWSRYSTKSAVVWAGDGPDGGNDTRAHVGNDDSEPWSDKQYTTAPLALDQITGAVLAQVSGAVERPDSSAATTQIRSDPVLPDTEMMDNTYCEPGLSMPLFRDRQTSRLLYHYMNHVAELLQPVLHPRNPWQTTYFPSALQGCQDNSSCQSISGPHSSASVSLFHSLLSAAAFHLRNATIDSKEFHQLALQHRIKALQALNTVAAHPVDLQSYGMQLTAMLALVTVDVCVLLFLSNPLSHVRAICSTAN